MTGLHPFNVRRSASKEGIEELAASIKEQGILEPLLVVPRPEAEAVLLEAAELGYSLPEGRTNAIDQLQLGIEQEGVANFWVLAGNRRLAAARVAGFTQVPCIIREDMRTLRAQQLVMLVENMQREDLNPIEQALTFKALRDSGMTTEQIAQKIGRAYNTVHDYLRLLSMPPIVQERISERQISYQAAIQACHSELSETDRQLIFADLVMHNLTAKQVRERVAECIEAQKKRAAQIREAEALMLTQNLPKTQVANGDATIRDNAAPVTESNIIPTDPDAGDENNQQFATTSTAVNLPNRQDNRIGAAHMTRMSGRTSASAGSNSTVAGAVAHIFSTRADATEQLTVREALLARLEQPEAGAVAQGEGETGNGSGVITSEVSITNNLLAYAFRQTCRECGMHLIDPKVCEVCPLVKSLTLALAAQPVLALQNQKAKSPA